MSEKTKENSKENEAKKDDSIKELEDLLSKDVMTSESDEERLIPKREMLGIIIRFSVMTVLALILYFIGVFEQFGVVIVAVLILGVLEGITIMKNIKARKNKPKFNFK